MEITVKLNLEEKVKIKDLKDLKTYFNGVSAVIDNGNFTGKIVAQINDYVNKSVSSLLNECGDDKDENYEISLDNYKDNQEGMEYTNPSIHFRAGNVAKADDMPGRYVIKVGSYIKLPFTESVGRATRECTDNAIKAGLIDANTGKVLGDVIVGSVSMAATMLAGTPTNGKPVFKDIMW